MRTVLSKSEEQTTSIVFHVGRNRRPAVALQTPWTLGVITPRSIIHHSAKDQNSWHNPCSWRSNGYCNTSQSEIIFRDKGVNERARASSLKYSGDLRFSRSLFSKYKSEKLRVENRILGDFGKQHARIEEIMYQRTDNIPVDNPKNTTNQVASQSLRLSSKHIHITQDSSDFLEITTTVLV